MQILLIGMLDEREPALALLKEKIELRGHQALIVDVSIGTGALAPALIADIGPAEIAQAAGSTIETIGEMLAKERDRATSLMAEGLAKKAVALHQAGQVDGVLAVAGMTGTFLSLTAMRALPFGLPKLLVSSVAAMPAYASRFAEYFGVRDITVMHTVTDTVGMNTLVRNLMLNAAGAICGMVEAYEPPVKSASRKPLVAMTEFGFCDQAAGYVRMEIESRYDVVSFHATGLGDRAVEDLVGQGFFDAFIDLVPANYGEYLLGGNRASASDRLEAAGRCGIPYILSPCGFDMLSCGPLERKDKHDPLWTSRHLADRQLFVQDAMRVQARTSMEEVAAVATGVASKLNMHRDRRLVKFIIPTRGFSSLSGEGARLYAPEIDRVFIDTLKEKLDPQIETVEVEAHINTVTFARAISVALTETVQKMGGETTVITSAG